jgi:hypothetical protein
VPVAEINRLLWSSNRYRYFAGTIAVVLVALASCTRRDDVKKVTVAYPGAAEPKTAPEMFAPGVISSEHQEHSSLAISPDGREMFWSRWRLPLDMDEYPQVIVFTRYEDGRWSSPEVAPFSGRYRDGGPAFSPDGKRIYFYSRRPVEEETDEMHDNDIWYVERIPSGWSRPVNLGSTVNSPHMDALPWLAANGNLYLTSNRIQYDDPTGNLDIFCAEYSDSGYKEPEGLGPSINTPDSREACPFVAPDESYIVFSRDSRRLDEDGNVVSGDRRLMISFRDENGEWGNAMDMGPEFVDTRFPSVSPDGKCFFFTKFTPGGHEDFYWVDANVIGELRANRSK